MSRGLDIFRLFVSRLRASPPHHHVGNEKQGKPIFPITRQTANAKQKKHDLRDTSECRTYTLSFPNGRTSISFLFFFAFPRSNFRRTFGKSLTASANEGVTVNKGVAAAAVVSDTRRETMQRLLLLLSLSLFHIIIVVFSSLQNRARAFLGRNKNKKKNAKESDCKYNTGGRKTPWKMTVAYNIPYDYVSANRITALDGNISRKVNCRDDVKKFHLPKVYVF